MNERYVDQREAWTDLENEMGRKLKSTEEESGCGASPCHHCGSVIDTYEGHLGPVCAACDLALAMEELGIEDAE